MQTDAQIALGLDDSLLVIQRSRYHLARGGFDHRRAAASEHLLVRRQRHGKVVWKRGGGDELRHGDDERPGLDRDVTHRRQPAVAVVGGRRDPDLRSAAVHAVTSQRHPVLPADQSANADATGVYDR
jgi:hypothetical protein